MIIETSREYLSLSRFGRKQCLYNAFVLHKLNKPCVTHGRELSKTTYPEVRNSSRLSTKIPFESVEMSVKNSKRFSNFRLHNCLGKVAHIATKRLSDCHRELWIRCNTLVAWQKLYMVLFSAPKATTSVLYCKRQTSILKATKSSVHLHVI